MGADFTSEASRALTLTLLGGVMMAAGALVGRSATPKEPAKGGTIGLATGFLTLIMLRQASALDRIAEHTNR